MDGKHTITHEFVPVTCHKSDIFRCHVKIDTIHLWTEFVVGSSEETASDTIQHHLGIHRNTARHLAHACRHREFVTILTNQIVLTILVVDLYGESVGIHIERDGLLRNLLDGTDELLGTDGKLALALGIRNLKMGNHGCLTVGSRHFQHSASQFEKDAIENWQSILRTLHTIDCLQAIAETGT